MRVAATLRQRRADARLLAVRYVRIACKLPRNLRLLDVKLAKLKRR